MSMLGLVSRRDAEKLIDAKKIRINGKFATVGQKVFINDIIKQKKTVMYHVFKEISNEGDSLTLDQLYNDSNSDDVSKIQKVFELFKNANVDVKTKDLVKNYSTKAINSLENINIENDKKSELIQICNKLISRDF